MRNKDVWDDIYFTYKDRIDSCQIKIWLTKIVQTGTCQLNSILKAIRIVDLHFMEG